MKIISVHLKNITVRVINEWLDTPCQSKCSIPTINLPDWVVVYIDNMYNNRSLFLRGILRKYIDFLKSIFGEPTGISPSRSEFIRHAFMWWYYTKIEYLKPLEENEDNLIIDGKEIIVLKRLD